MIPGRFPSPPATPLLGSSPVESNDEFPKMFPTSSARAANLSFIASDDTCMPRELAELRSVPVFPLYDGMQNSSRAHCVPISTHRMTNTRRVSDALQNRSKAGARPGDNAVCKPTKQQRAISNPFPVSVHIDSCNNTFPSRHDITPTRAPPTQCPRVTDMKLHKKLLEPLTGFDGEGVLYVLRDPARPERGIKIGYTTCSNYEDRIKQHARNCGFLPKELYITQRLEYRKRMEALVHLDLQEFCRHWDCKTKAHKGTTHEEWFQVDGDMAVQTVKKWEAFMNEQRPYRFWRRVDPLWTYLLRRRGLAHLVHGDTSHRQRRQHWAQILAAPTYFDYLVFVSHLVLQAWHAAITAWLSLRPFVAKFFWQANTVIFSFMFLVAVHSTFASCAFAAVLVCVSFSVLHQSVKLKFLGR